MIRDYGPGKFDTILDSYVYDVSLDGGCDDECGSVGESGRWYGLMRDGSTVFRDHDPFCESLNDEERDLLSSSAGVILTEDSYGFVWVYYIDNAKDLESDWQEIVDKVAEFYNEED